jgi:hypothetical protein
MRKKKNNSKALVLFMLIIFVLSTVGSVVVYYSNGQSTVTKTYSGTRYKFKPNTDSIGNMYYQVTYDDDEFISYFLPEAISLQLDDGVKSLIKSSSYFYFAFRPNDTNAQLIDFLRFDIRNSLPAGRFFIDSVTEADPRYSLPLMTCSNATASAPVMVFKSGNVTKVEKSGYCVNVEFSREATLQLRDSFVYLLNGVEI